MIIIKNDKLTHVESSTDILEHYGVKGMRWGKHRSNMKKVRQEQKSRIKKLKSDKKISVKTIRKENRDNDKTLAAKVSGKTLAAKIRGKRTASYKDLESHARTRVKLVEKRGNDELAYKTAKLDKRFQIKKQRYIDKYSSTNDLKGLNDKGMKKLDKEAHRYARGGTKNVSKQLKKNERRLFAPFETEAYSNGYGTLVTTKHNPLLKRENIIIKNHK